MSTLAMLQLEPQPTILSPGTGSRETPITEELGFEILSNNIVLKIDILLKALRWIFSQKGQRAETQIISTYKSGSVKITTCFWVSANNARARRQHRAQKAREAVVAGSKVVV